MNRPVCFVLMPFGQKADAAGTIVDFDAVYHQIIAPAIRRAEMEPLRADEEMTGGIIHKPMFERLILCEYAVADLTTANANVFYELGLRHAVRPWSTVIIFAQGGRLPFDVAPLRGLPYSLSPGGVPADAGSASSALTQRLIEARNASTDSPIFQLLEWIQGPSIERAVTDVFREQVASAAQMKERLAGARKKGVEAVHLVEQDLAPIGDAESGVVIDLFLSYRAVKAWPEMIALVDKMSRPLAGTVLVQEQLALALNRDGQSERAERVLLDLLKHRGPSSETYGILGRVYKDRWDAARKRGESILARGLLDKAIEAYRRGFETDWRDPYPGINALTLMEIKEPPDPQRQELIPVVAYAVQRRIAAGTPTYWDHATRLELAVVRNAEDDALAALGDALASDHESWQLDSTGGNLRLIREARERRHEDVSWLQQVEDTLQPKSHDPAPQEAS